MCLCQTIETDYRTILHLCVSPQLICYYWLIDSSLFQNSWKSVFNPLINHILYILVALCSSFILHPLLEEAILVVFVLLFERWQGNAYFFFWGPKTAKFITGNRLDHLAILCLTNSTSVLFKKKIGYITFTQSSFFLIVLCLLGLDDI